jgi:hypothetical protein
MVTSSVNMTGPQGKALFTSSSTTSWAHDGVVEKDVHSVANSDIFRAITGGRSEGLGSRKVGVGRRLMARGPREGKGLHPEASDCPLRS